MGLGLSVARHEGLSLLLSPRPRLALRAAQVLKRDDLCGKFGTIVKVCACGEGSTQQARYSLRR